MNRPLTPSLSPSEGERENRHQAAVRIQRTLQFHRSRRRRFIPRQLRCAVKRTVFGRLISVIFWAVLD